MTDIFKDYKTVKFVIIGKKRSNLSISYKRSKKEKIKHYYFEPEHLYFLPQHLIDHVNNARLLNKSIQIYKFVPMKLIYVEDK